MIFDQFKKGEVALNLGDLADYDFSKANITKENSQSFLKFTLLYSKSEIEENRQFKENLTKFLEIIATRTNIIGARNDQTSDSQRVLDAINGYALVNSQNIQETSKPKFQISISSLAESANLFSNDYSQNPNKNQFGGGVFATRVEENQLLNKIPQLPKNFNQSPNYAHRSFLNEVLGVDNYASEFAAQAGENINIFLHHLFFNSQNEELKNLLGNDKYQELQDKISQSPLLCIPPAPNSPENTASSFQFENTYGNQGEINVGAVLDDKTLSLGIFNGVNLKLGLRINEDGSKEIGLFDNNNKLLIDSDSVIEMYKKSGMNSDSLARTIANFRSLDSNRNGQVSYIESDSTFSLRCLNGIWYLGIFQSKKVQEVQKDQEGQEDKEGQNILEFTGAIKIDKDNLSKIIAIPEFRTQNSLNQTIQEKGNEQGTQNLVKINSNNQSTLFSSVSLTPSISLGESDSSSRISSDGTNSSTGDENRKLLSSGDGEDAPKAHCCCNLFSRVSKRFSKMQKNANPIIKAIKSTNLSNLMKTLSQYR